MATPEPAAADPRGCPSIKENMTGFFGVLAEWAQAEAQQAAKEPSAGRDGSADEGGRS